MNEIKYQVTVVHGRTPQIITLESASVEDLIKDIDNLIKLERNKTIFVRETSTNRLVASRFDKQWTV